MVEKLKKSSILKSLEETVERTAKSRDRVTNRLWGELLVPTISPREFVIKACRISKIKGPVANERLAPFIFKLQNILKLPLEDRFDGCDGKGGPITLYALKTKYPSLKRWIKESQAEFIQKRMQFAKKAGLKSPTKISRKAKAPQKLPKGAHVEKTPVSSRSKLTIGDSLSVGLRYRSKFVKGNRSVITMRKMVERNQHLLSRYKAFTVWGGANNIGYMSGARIFNELKRIYLTILKNNPNARIVAIELPPSAGWRRFRTKAHKRRVIRRVLETNRLIREFAKLYPKNMSVIKIYDYLEYKDEERRGYSRLKSDGLHLNRTTYRAIAGMVKQDLETGDHDSLETHVSKVRGKRRRRYA